MTLAARLAELKEVDSDTEFDISEWCGQLQTIPTCDLGQALIQNSIQRACERREWIWHHGHGPEMGYVATVNHGNIAKGDSAAEALLAAYIAAVREEAK